MEFKKIEHLIYNQNLINPNDFYSRKEYKLKLDSMLINNLQKCIDNNISIDMDELDLSKIYKVYLRLIKNNYDINNNFIKDLSKLSKKKLDYMSVIQEITE